MQNCERFAGAAAVEIGQPRLLIKYATRRGYIYEKSFSSHHSASSSSLSLIMMADHYDPGFHQMRKKLLLATHICIYLALTLVRISDFPNGRIVVITFMEPPSFVGSMCPEIRPSLPKYLHALRPGLSPNITLHAFLLSLTVRKNLSITEEGIVDKRSH